MVRDELRSGQTRRFERAACLRIPFSMLVDQQGIVRYIEVPPASLDRLVRELLASDEVKEESGAPAKPE